MQEKYRNALAEVDEILNIYNDDSVNKIPKSFRDFIKQNKSANYEVNINEEMSLKEQNILYETKVVLAVIYRDFLADEKEKQELNEIQRNKAIQIEKEKQKKYDPNKIFKSTEIENNVVEGKKEKDKAQITEIAEIKNESFWNKIINKIKSLFRRK